MIVILLLIRPLLCVSFSLFIIYSFIITIIKSAVTNIAQDFNSGFVEAIKTDLLGGVFLILEET